jgi:hypothetical protein
MGALGPYPAGTAWIDGRSEAPRAIRSQSGAPSELGTHRQHAIIETVFADLIDGPLAHLPSGRFGANSAWILCAAISHNLLRAAGVLAGDQHTRARGSTLRRKIINIPARQARPQRRPVLHLPTHWPWSTHWLALWNNMIGRSPPRPATP